MIGAIIFEGLLPFIIAAMAAPWPPMIFFLLREANLSRRKAYVAYIIIQIAFLWGAREILGNDPYVFFKVVTGIFFAFYLIGDLGREK
jgi:hypothetical protein